MNLYQAKQNGKLLENGTAHSKDYWRSLDIWMLELIPVRENNRKAEIDYYNSRS
jgi:hypothetical protein